MRLSKITFTGADDSIDPRELFYISNKYQQVEWAILLSRSRVGTPTFPSASWQGRLERTYRENPIAQFAAHICGAYVREFVENDLRLFTENPQLEKLFGRMQINFFRKPIPNYEPFRRAMVEHSKTRQLIFQMDGVNDRLFERLIRDGVRCQPLFDRSGGEGVLARTYPTPYPGVVNGYAGGLAPDNLERELAEIAQSVDNAEIWVDMQSGVRSGDGAVFDLDKVRRCLEIASKYF